MKPIGLILISIWGIVIVSCCVSADCGSYESNFSIKFITEDRDYYFFKDSNDVDLKVFYNDSIFIQVNKQEVGKADSTLITFFLSPIFDVDDYVILANDTLLGNLNLSYGLIESQCCGTKQEIVDFSFESDQAFSTEFGLHIIL